jgi:hypothetical protein
MNAWVIVLEWAVAEGVPLGADAQPVNVLLNSFADCCPVALCAVDRYALQLEIDADDPLDALAAIMARHAEGAEQAHLTGWKLDRAEVMTREQMEQDWHNGVNGIDARVELERTLRTPGLDPVAKADRALGDDICPHEARDILCRMVRELGGGLVSAREEDEWTLTVDLSFGTGEPLLPVAEPWSQARIRLEQVLPPLVERARCCMLNVEACKRHVGGLR